MKTATRSSRAFTLIEMVIVLTVLGLIVGLTAPRLVRGGAVAKSRDAVRGLVDALTAQRAEVIRSMAPARLYLVSGPEPGSGGSPSILLVGCTQADATEATLGAMLTGRGRIEEPFFALGVWTGVGLALADPEIAGQASWRVRTILFEPTGRSRLDGGESGLVLVVADDGDTIRWRIEFDPISGVPAVGAG
jgi:prepilin-type N-terminal cleavage/methylation domain-containing protein